MWQSFFIFLEKYTEFLNIKFFDVFLFVVIMLFTFFLLQLANKNFIQLIINNNNTMFLIIIIFLMFIIIVITGNLKIVINISLFLPFIFVTPLSVNSRLFIVFTYSVCYLFTTLVLPFVVIQENETLLYIFFFVSNLYMIKYLNSTIRYMFTCSIIIIYNIIFMGIFCLTFCLDVTKIPENVFVAFVFTLFILYCLFFYIYYYLISRKYKNLVKNLCSIFDNKHKIGLFFFMFSICCLSLCLKYIYISNVLIFSILDSIGLIEFLSGSKNPHHTWICNKYTSTLFGSYCKEYSTCRIFKQEQESYLNLQKNLRDVKRYLDNDITKPITKSDYLLMERITLFIERIKRDPYSHPRAIISADDINYLTYIVTHSEKINNIATIPFPKISNASSSFLVPKGMNATKQDFKDATAFANTDAGDISKKYIMTDKNARDVVALNSYLEKYPDIRDTFVNYLVSKYGKNINENKIDQNFQKNRNEFETSLHYNKILNEIRKNKKQ